MNLFPCSACTGERQEACQKLYEKFHAESGPSLIRAHVMAFEDDDVKGALKIQQETLATSAEFGHALDEIGCEQTIEEFSLSSIIASAQRLFIVFYQRELINDQTAWKTELKVE